MGYRTQNDRRLWLDLPQIYGCFPWENEVPNHENRRYKRNPYTIGNILRYCSRMFIMYPSISHGFIPWGSRWGVYEEESDCHCRGWSGNGRPIQRMIHLNRCTWYVRVVKHRLKQRWGSDTDKSIQVTFTSQILHTYSNDSISPCLQDSILTSMV